MKASARVDGSGKDVTLLLTIEGLPVDAGRLSNPRVLIRRTSGSYRCLTPNGWDEQEEWLTPISCEAHGSMLQLRLEPCVGGCVFAGTEISVAVKADGLASLDAVTCQVTNSSGAEAAPTPAPRRPLPDSAVSWSRWGLALLAIAVIGAVGGFLWYVDSSPACVSERLEALMVGDLPPQKLTAEGIACLDSVKSPNDHGKVAAAARLFRAAADAGNAEGALRLGKLYDPKDIVAGRLGQMPRPDFEIAFDNYRRAMQLGSAEAKTRLDELRVFAQVKAQEGDPRARRLLERWP